MSQSKEKKLSLFSFPYTYGPYTYGRGSTSLKNTHKVNRAQLAPCQHTKKDKATKAGIIFKTAAKFIPLMVLKMHMHDAQNGHARWLQMFILYCI